MNRMDKLAKEVQDAFNKAVSSKDPNDMAEYERLEDEYYIQMELNRKRITDNYKRNSDYNDN